MPDAPANVEPLIFNHGSPQLTIPKRQRPTTLIRFVTHPARTRSNGFEALKTGNVYVLLPQGGDHAAYRADGARNPRSCTSLEPAELAAIRRSSARWG